MKLTDEQLNAIMDKADDDLERLKDRCHELYEENQQLKEVLNCKKYFSSIMPEDTEFVILTKANYDRQQKDIQLELIECKNRIDKAIEHIKYYQDTSTNEWRSVWNDLLNILQNGSEDDV